MAQHFANLDADNVVAGDVPGTIHLVDIEGTMRGVKHSEGATADIVLYPTPSSDPEDPLNWSRRRKLLQAFCLHLYAFMTSVGSATGYVVYPQIIAITGISLNTLNSAAGCMLLFYGWGCLIWCPLGLQFGRRGIYIMSTLGCMAMTLWAPYTTSSGTWYAHRILFGFFGAPVEALVEQSIPDVFFTHERGVHVATYMFCITGSSFMAPIAAGYVAETMDWKWCYYFPAIFLGATALFLFFFMEETMYDRELLQTQAAARAEAQRLSSGSPLRTDNTADVPVDEKTITSSVRSSESEQYIYLPRSYLDKLKLFRIIPGKKNVLVPSFLRPLQHMWSFPIMTLCGFEYGVHLMVFSVMNGTWTTVFAPYGFSSGIVGVFYICPTIGAFIAIIFCGYGGDWFRLYRTRRNGGIREPEYSLWLYITVSILMPVGLILFGVGGAHHVHWIGLAFGSAMLGFTSNASGAIAIAYISDSYKDLTAEGMITMTLLRNTLGFAAGYYITPWLDTSGIQNTFIGMAMIGFGLSLIYYPFIWFGKSERRRTKAKYHKEAAKTIMKH